MTSSCGQSANVVVGTMLQPALLTIDRADIAPRAQVGVTPPLMVLGDWRRSGQTADKPKPGLVPDNNSWAFLRSAMPTPAEPQPGWRVYNNRLTPWKRIAAGGGTLRFASVGGRAELWVDGKKLAEKTDAAPAPLEAAFPAGSGQRAVELIVQAPAGQPSGLLGKVTLTPR